MRFICSQHPKRKGKSLDARLRTESIGISPLHLLYGRAASYGSIINPCTCHRHLREQLGFLLYKSLSLAFFRKVLAFLQPRLRFSHTRNVPNECVFSCQSKVGDFYLEKKSPQVVGIEKAVFFGFFKKKLKNFFKKQKRHFPKQGKCLERTYLVTFIIKRKSPHPSKEECGLYYLIIAISLIRNPD